MTRLMSVAMTLVACFFLFQESSGFSASPRLRNGSGRDVRKLFARASVMSRHTHDDEYMRALSTCTDSSSKKKKKKKKKKSNWFKKSADIVWSEATDGFGKKTKKNVLDPFWNWVTCPVGEKVFVNIAGAIILTVLTEGAAIEWFAAGIEEDLDIAYLADDQILSDKALRQAAADAAKQLTEAQEASLGGGPGSPEIMSDGQLDDIVADIRARESIPEVTGPLPYELVEDYFSKGLYSNLVWGKGGSIIQGSARCYDVLVDATKPWTSNILQVTSEIATTSGDASVINIVGDTNPIEILTVGPWDATAGSAESSKVLNVYTLTSHDEFTVSLKDLYPEEFKVFSTRITLYNPANEAQMNVFDDIITKLIKNSDELDPIFQDSVAMAVLQEGKEIAYMTSKDAEVFFDSNQRGLYKGSGIEDAISKGILKYLDTSKFR